MSTPKIQQRASSNQHRLFRSPIGTLRELGTARTWLIELTGLLLWFASFIVLLILL